MTDNKSLAKTIRNYLESDADLLLTDDDYRTIIKVLEQEPCSNCRKFERYAKQMGLDIEAKTDILDKIKEEIEEKAERYCLSRESIYMGQVEWSERLINEK